MWEPDHRLFRKRICMSHIIKLHWKGDPSAEHGGQRILAEQISRDARAPFGRATALEVVEGGAGL